MKLFLVLSAVLSIALSHPYKSSGGYGGHEGKFSNKNKCDNKKKMNLDVLYRRIIQRWLHNCAKMMIN